MHEITRAIVKVLQISRITHTVIVQFYIYFSFHNRVDNLNKENIPNIQRVAAATSLETQQKNACFVARMYKAAAFRT